VTLDYQKLYDDELDRWDRLRSAVGTPIVLLTLLGGVLGTMRQSIISDDSLLWRVFLFAFTSAICSFVGGVYFLIRSYHGQSYEVMGTALKLKEYRDSLTDWYTKYGGDAAEADKEFTANLDADLARKTDHNAAVNAVKSAFLFRATTAIIYCGIFTALAFLSHVVLQEGKPGPTYRVEIVEPGRVLKGDGPSARPTRAPTGTAPKASAATGENHQGRPNPQGARQAGKVDSQPNAGRSRPKAPGPWSSRQVTDASGGRESSVAVGSLFDSESAPSLSQDQRLHLCPYAKTLATGAAARTWQRPLNLSRGPQLKRDPFRRPLTHEKWTS